jgi:hypothetical protein
MDEDKFRVCTKCNNKKSIDNFPLFSKVKSNQHRSWWCKSCLYSWVRYKGLEGEINRDFDGVMKGNKV